ncbi:MAG: hemolysin family protein [Pseudomonadota bacterium]
MTLLIIYLAIAIGVSFLCSILEAVLLSITPGHVESTLEQYPRRGKVVKQVKDDLEQSISAILILNTFAHTMGAAGVGAQALQIFGPRYETLVAVLLTLAILYLSEIIPKTLGARLWKQLAIPAAYIIRVMVKLLFPLVWLSARITSLFSQGDASNVSREELAAMIKLGARHGALGSQESELVENIMRMRGTRTGEILTPRKVVFALDSALSLSEAREQISASPFSRVPVYSGDLDWVQGMVFRPQIIEAAHKDDAEGKKLADFLHPVNQVSEELPVLLLMDQFIKRREHLFIVVDEYGQTAGIVTLEDAIETLLGREIMDESDQVEDMQELAKRQYRDHLRSR